MTARGTTLFYVFAALIPTARLCAQQPDDRQTKSSKVLLLESPGPITTLYVSSVEEGALRLQKSMETAHAWYRKQLHLQDVPVTVVILDKDLWERFRVPGPFTMPVSYLAPTGTVAIPAHTEDPAGANAGVAGAEGVSFHELGHLFANQLKIWSGNQFVNELIAGIFLEAYVRAERPDLPLLAPINAPFPAGTSPRYTSLADLDYLYVDGLAAKNYFWFQHHLERLADFLVKDQSFPEVIEKLQAAFPADHQKHETIEEIDAHLEAIRPGFKKMAGPLGEPSTIIRIKPSACQEAPEKSGSSTAAFVIVQNDMPEPLVVTRPGGTKATVLPRNFLSFRIPVGASLQLPDGACLVARDEPTLAVMEKQ